MKTKTETTKKTIGKSKLPTQYIIILNRTQSTTRDTYGGSAKRLSTSQNVCGRFLHHFESVRSGSSLESSRRTSESELASELREADGSSRSSGWEGNYSWELLKEPIGKITCGPFVVNGEGLVSSHYVLCLSVGSPLSFSRNTNTYTQKKRQNQSEVYLPFGLTRSS